MGRAGIVGTVSALFLFTTISPVNETELRLTGKELATLYRLIHTELEASSADDEQKELKALLAKVTSAILQSCRDR